jgi:hypothetical protein
MAEKQPKYLPFPTELSDKFKLDDPGNLLKGMDLNDLYKKDTDKLLDWYISLNSPTTIRLRQNNARMAGNSIDAMVDDIIGQNVDMASEKDVNKRIAKATEIIKSFAKIWYKTVLGQNYDSLTTEQVDTFIRLAGLNPQQTGTRATTIEGVARHIADYESSLSTADENNRYLGALKNLIVGELTGKQDKAIGKIRDELVSNHSRYDTLVSRTNKLLNDPTRIVGDKAGPDELMIEINKYLMDKFKEPPQRSYYEQRKAA